MLAYSHWVMPSVSRSSEAERDARGFESLRSYV